MYSEGREGVVQDILSSNKLTNQVCEVARYGFKSKSDNVIRQALKAWHALTDVFASNPQWSLDEPNGTMIVYTSEIADRFRHYREEGGLPTESSAICRLACSHRLGRV